MRRGSISSFSGEGSGWGWSSRTVLVALLLFVAPEPTLGQQPLRLSFPVACEPGTSCSLQNYFDHDRGPAARDYHCGRLTYDGHDGTDIRLASLEQMRAGVRVLAAAEGVVRAVRDSMQDVSFRTLGKDAIKGREAGNSVALVHDGGWETQYSHLRRGSVMVKSGERVKRGQPLGLIGLSGWTEFPHLHLSVRHNGTTMDPFAGPGPHAKCGASASTLWDADSLRRLAYVPTGLLAAGFAGEAPTHAQVKDGKIPRAHGSAAALVFWVNAYGIQAGDEEHVRLVAPDGRVVSESRSSIPTDKAEWFSYAGRKRSGATWPTGRYRGEYTLSRKGDDARSRAVLTLAREIAIAP